jgi:hypothetical protein
MKNRDMTCVDCGRHWQEYPHELCECGGELHDAQGLSDMTIKKRLSEISDELMDYADLLPDNEAAQLRRAAYALEDVRTSQAVGELVQAAAHQYGAPVGPVPFGVLREKRI